MKKEIARFIKEKKDIELMAQDLIKRQDEIKDKVSKSEGIQDKNSQDYKKLYNEIQDDIENRKVVYDYTENKIQKLEKDISSSKQNILKKLEAKKELVSKNKDNKDVKDFNIKELNEKKKKLQERMKLSKTSKAEIEKMPSDKQKEVEEAKKSFNNDKAEFVKVRNDIDLYYLIGKGNREKGMTPEKILKQIEDTISQINEKFDMEHIEEMNDSQDKENKENKDTQEEQHTSKSQQTKGDSFDVLEQRKKIYDKSIKKINKVTEYIKQLLDSSNITDQQKKFLADLIDTTIEEVDKLIESLPELPKTKLNLEGDIFRKIGQNLNDIDETVKTFEKQKDISYEDMRNFTNNKKALTNENIDLFNKLYGLKDGGIQSFDPETRSKIYENIMQINGLFKAHESAKNDPSLAASYRIAANSLKEEIDELVQSKLNKDFINKGDEDKTSKVNLDKGRKDKTPKVDLDKGTKKTTEKDLSNNRGNAIILPDMQSINSVTKEKHERLKNEIYRLTNMMEQFKDNPEMCVKLKNMVDFLNEENEKLFTGNNKEGKDENVGQNSNSGNNLSEGKGKDNKPNETKSLDEDLKANLNAIDKAIYKYKNYMNMLKDNPEQYANCQNAIDNLMKKKEQLLQKGLDNSDKPGNDEQTEKSKGKVRPKLEFFINTGYWLYVDENGDSFTVDLYDKDKKGKLKSCIKDENVEEVKLYIMKEFGLTGYQVENVDMQLWRVLIETDNLELRDKYIQSIKDGNKTDKGFDLTYNLQTKGKKTERRKLDRKSKKQQKKNAKRHEELGLAKIIRDKRVNLKIVGLIAGAVAAVAAIGTGIKTLKLGPAQNQSVRENNSDNNKDKLNEKHYHEQVNDRVDEQKQNHEDRKIDDVKITEMGENEDLGVHCGDFVKVQSGSILYVDPTDSINISQGKQPTQKIQVKSVNSADRLYKVSMEGYYSPDGKSVCIEEGKGIEEALKEKGLDKSYIEDENTTKMYHVVSNGVAQWVDAEAVQKSDRQFDRLGNAIDKTDEEKAVEEAYQSYMNERSQNQQSNETEK